MRWVAVAVGTLALAVAGCGGTSHADADVSLTPVRARDAQASVVDIAADAPATQRLGCLPAPEGAAPAELHFEIEPVTQADQTFLLDSPSHVVRFYDDETDLSLRRIHRVYERADGVKVEDGTPYLEVGNACLELIERVELQNAGYRFVVTALGCEPQSRSAEDYVYNALSSCRVRVETFQAPPASNSSGAAHHSLFSLADRFDALSQKPVGAQLIALRSTGTQMGNVDFSVMPPDVRGVDAGLDVITSFGVANLELSYFNEQVIGAKRQVSLGPQVFTLTIQDVGNTNTHCYTGICKNVFDLDVLAEPTGAAAPIRILSYR